MGQKNIERIRGPRVYQWVRRMGLFLLGLVCLYLLLLIPEPGPGEINSPEGEPFVWGQDQVWDRLESRFLKARQMGCDAAAASRSAALNGLEASVAELGDRAGNLPSDDPLLTSLEERLFETSAAVAACPEDGAERLLALHGQMRAHLKRASVEWDLEGPDRARLYRLLYGGRMAVEEVLLQLPAQKMPVVFESAAPTPSTAPSVVLRGVRVHSGDILLSRGGAPTSALIARGNDHPGNFSHVALVHVSEEGGFETIEAHIESGVMVAGAEKYTGDPKLRIMLLRLREGLGDPHAAAAKAVAQARGRHIDYDFAMDHEDPTRLFCSEVASSVYREQGVELWKGLTTMSSPTTARWLSAFGVRHFTTHGPSDLEYDPQITVVAEWRDPSTLFKDHLDDAVIDAMLEFADEHGQEVGHAALMLPVARLVKVVSWAQNMMGGPGIIPKGMSPTTALRAKWLDARHEAIAAQVRAEALTFETEEGYKPPYWRLLAMARRAAAR